MSGLLSCFGIVPRQPQPTQNRARDRRAVPHVPIKTHRFAPRSIVLSTARPRRQSLAAVLAALCAMCPDLAPAASPTTIVVRPSQPGPEGSPNKPDRNTRLMARAELAMKDLDIVAARRLLEVPAEQGHVQAARRLAETYDPVWLVKSGVLNAELFADPAQAFEWYKKAFQLGDIAPGNRYTESLSAGEK